MDLSDEEKALIEQLRRGKQKEQETPDSNNFEDFFLGRQEYKLNSEIDTCIALADPAFKQVFPYPTTRTIADVDRVIGLLNLLSSHTQRLKNSGRPNAHIRLVAVLDDLTLARATLSETIGMLGAADIKDAVKFRAEEKEWLDKQKEFIIDRLVQGESNSEELRKLL